VTYTRETVYLTICSVFVLTRPFLTVTWQLNIEKYVVYLRSLDYMWLFCKGALMYEGSSVLGTLRVLWGSAQNLQFGQDPWDAFSVLRWMPCLCISHFPQISPTISGSCAARDLQYKDSYASSPPCIRDPVICAMCWGFQNCTLPSTWRGNDVYAP